MTEKESSIQYTPGMKAFTDPEDRKFCGKCRFAAPEQLRQDYLCDSPYRILPTTRRI